VDPAGTARRSWRQDRLSRNDEPGRKRFDFHCAERIGRRGAGNNELGVVFSLGVQLYRLHNPQRALRDLEVRNERVKFRRAAPLARSRIAAGNLS
jgi:hypothetical protein